MKRIEVKLPDELHLKFKEYCDEQYRSMHGEILWLIQETLKNHEKQDVGGGGIKEMQRKKEGAVDHPRG